jgi:hypothetical protein
MKNEKTSFQHSALQRTFPTWRNFAKAGALFATLSGLMLLGTSCGGGDEYEQVEVIDTIVNEELTKGLITTVKEVKPGQFAVEDEQVVETKDSSRILVKYLDGKTESLTIDEAKARVQPQDSLAARDTALHVVASTDASTTDANGSTTTTTTPSTKTTKSGNTTTTTTTTADGKTVIINNTTASPQYHSSYSPGMHTLGYVLMGSAVGYYMGKSMAMPPNPNVYRNPQQTYQAQRYGGGGGTTGRTYAYSSLRSSAKRTVSTRTSYKSVPSSGRSGYMGKGGRSSSSGGRSSYSG